MQKKNCLLCFHCFYLRIFTAQYDDGSHVSYVENTGKHWMYNANVLDTFNGDWATIAPYSSAAGGIQHAYYSDSTLVYVAGGVDNTAVWLTTFRHTTH
jgi:hypothetical protein